MVGRELERRWEQALIEQRNAEEEYDRFRRGRPAELTGDEIDMIKSLSKDVPALWRAATTTAADRKEVVRHLVERVAVAVQGETEWVDVTIHWAGGFVSRHEVRRPVRRVEQLRDYPALLARVTELHGTGKTAREIAEALNREGIRPPKRRETYNAAMVRQLLSRQGRSGPRPEGGDRRRPARGRRVVAQRPVPRAGDAPADGPLLGPPRLGPRPEAAGGRRPLGAVGGRRGPRPASPAPRLSPLMAGRAVPAGVDDPEVRPIRKPIGPSTRSRRPGRRADTRCDTGIPQVGYAANALRSIRFAVRCSG